MAAPHMTGAQTSDIATSAPSTRLATSRHILLHLVTCSDEGCPTTHDDAMGWRFFYYETRVGITFDVVVCRDNYACM